MQLSKGSIQVPTTKNSLPANHSASVVEHACMRRNVTMMDEKIAIINELLSISRTYVDEEALTIIKERTVSSARARAFNCLLKFHLTTT